MSIIDKFVEIVKDNDFIIVVILDKVRRSGGGSYSNRDVYLAAEHNGKIHAVEVGEIKRIVEQEEVEQKLIEIQKAKEEEAIANQYFIVGVQVRRDFRPMFGGERFKHLEYVLGKSIAYFKTNPTSVFGVYVIKLIRREEEKIVYLYQNGEWIEQLDAEWEKHEITPEA